MIRVWLAFIVLSVLIHFSISSWRALGGLERWELTKSIVYSIMIALLVTAILTTFVILF